MDPMRQRIAVGPHQLLVGGHLQQLHRTRFALTVTGDHRIAIGQPLCPARIDQKWLGKIPVAQPPDDVSLAIEFDDDIAMRAGRQGVA